MKPTNGAEVALGKINGKYELWMTPDRIEFHTRLGWEKERVDSVAELLKPGMTAWDIGAESADFTAWYGILVGEAGAVVPIEPSPPYWPSIRAHFEANDVPLKAWFAGFASDVTKLIPDKIDDKYASTIEVDESGWPVCSLGPVIPDFGFRHLVQQAHHTPQATIDDLVTLLHSTPDAIVIDVEGSELRVLQGANRVLREVRPLMWVSVHQPIMAEWYGITLDDIIEYMESVDYDYVKLGEGSEEYWLGLPR